MDNQNQNKSNKLISLAKLGILILIVIGIPTFVLIHFWDGIQTLGNKDSLFGVVEFLQRYKTESYFVYIALQIMQIVISVLPGQVFQMAAGYLYGFPLGLLLSVIGATLGSVIAYYIARFLGRDAVKLFVKEDKIEYWVSRLNSKRAYIIVFLLYLIPGLPKDMIAYVAGVSDMKLRAFITLSILGRLPAMSASIAFGTFYESESYYLAAIVALISIVIFIICLIKRNAVSAFIDIFYEKLSQ